MDTNASWLRHLPWPNERKYPQKDYSVSENRRNRKLERWKREKKKKIPWNNCFSEVREYENFKYSIRISHLSFFFTYFVKFCFHIVNVALFYFLVLLLFCSSVFEVVPKAVNGKLSSQERIFKSHQRPERAEQLRACKRGEALGEGCNCSQMRRSNHPNHGLSNKG